MFASGVIATVVDLCESSAVSSTQFILSMHVVLAAGFSLLSEVRTAAYVDAFSSVDVGFILPDCSVYLRQTMDPVDASFGAAELVNAAQHAMLQVCATPHDCVLSCVVIPTWLTLVHPPLCVHHVTVSSLCLLRETTSLAS
jgi:hypothetical protein